MVLDSKYTVPNFALRTAIAEFFVAASPAAGSLMLSSSMIPCVAGKGRTLRHAVWHNQRVTLLAVSEAELARAGITILASINSLSYIGAYHGCTYDDEYKSLCLVGESGPTLSEVLAFLKQPFSNAMVHVILVAMEMSCHALEALACKGVFLQQLSPDDVICKSLNGSDKSACVVKLLSWSVAVAILGSDSSCMQTSNSVTTDKRACVSTPPRILGTDVNVTEGGSGHRSQDDVTLSTCALPEKLHFTKSIVQECSGYMTDRFLQGMAAFALLICECCEDAALIAAQLGVPCCCPPIPGARASFAPVLYLRRCQDCLLARCNSNSGLLASISQLRSPAMS